jgi:EamA domain-containing membrane protein RarD
MFLLAVFVFEEPLSVHQLISFIFIWTALAIYALDSIRN